MTCRDTQAAQNLKSANKKQIHNNSDFHFCLNIEILCIYTKYRSYPSFSTRLICRSLSFLITQVLLETVAAFVPKLVDLTVAVVSVETALLVGF